MPKRHAHATKSAPTPNTATAPPPATTKPHEAAEHEARVREAAYFLYKNEGCRSGRALDDWLVAQAQIEAQRPGVEPRGGEAGIEQVDESSPGTAAV